MRMATLDVITVRPITVTETKDGSKEVTFHPDDKGHWGNMEITKTVG